ncbi:hypothetical protein PENARI_c017G06277 [Penicillium arizonense]|uniref:Uncharacterized protein n=1 Tax=Penicillium arizonense TaxID=1835702 RepID=A0A1F5LBE1_PENAI|nr:hypothetical protein PENARI_c017G06277 [Penicillium arizonense]OGE50249.1 hypothetical protein PENARI_c017G06277 [Penicillium arizonense]
MAAVTSKLIKPGLGSLVLALAKAQALEAGSGVAAVAKSQSQSLKLLLSVIHSVPLPMQKSFNAMAGHLSSSVAFMSLPPL